VFVSTDSAPDEFVLTKPAEVRPNLVRDELTTGEFRVVPVSAPASATAVNVPEPPSGISVPLIVTDELTSIALVTVEPGSVTVPVKVGLLRGA
jgi:hypothetical protein